MRPRLRSPLLIAVVGAPFLMSGCSGDDGATAGTATTSTSSTTSSTADESTSSSTTDQSSSTTEESTSEGMETTGAPATVTISGRLRVMPDGYKLVTQGDICFVTPDQAVGPCTLSDNYGRYELEGVPADTQGALLFKDNLIVSFAMALHTAADDLDVSLTIDTPALVQSYYDDTGVERIDGRVIVLTEVYPAAPGYSATLEPAVGDGPFYYETVGGILDLEATESSDKVAMAVFLNVDPALAPFAAPMSKDGVVCETTKYGVTYADSFVPDEADILYFSRTCR